MHYTSFCCERQVQQHVRLAQLDRASGYGPEGRGFESSCARQRQIERFVFFWFARHGRALTGESPEHAQIVGSV